jgi:hypothetical protein
MNAQDLKLQAALATLARNRSEMRARFMPADERLGGGADAFPRSTTLRWLLAAVTNRNLISAALETILGRYPLGRALAAWVMSR